MCEYWVMVTQKRYLWTAVRYYMCDACTLGSHGTFSNISPQANLPVAACPHFSYTASPVFPLTLCDGTRMWLSWSVRMLAEMGVQWFVVADDHMCQSRAAFFKCMGLCGGYGFFADLFCSVFWEIARVVRHVCMLRQTLEMLLQKFAWLTGCELNAKEMGLFVKCVFICPVCLAAYCVLTAFLFRTVRCWRWRPNVSRTWSFSSWSVRADRMRRRRRTHSSSSVRWQTTSAALLIARPVPCCL